MLAEKQAKFNATLERLKANDPTLIDVNFNNFNLDKDDVKLLAGALKINSSLQSLYLMNNQICKEGAIALAGALKINSSLQSLYLMKNQIGKEGAIALADALKSNTSLQTIDLSGNQIDNEGATALAEALKTNNSLQRLFLAGNNIGNEGAIALADALKSYNSLNELHLMDNQIGNEGAIALADALKSDNSLQSLNLNYNNIGKEGAIAFADALKSNNYLNTLYFSWNNIDNPNFKNLIYSFTKINESRAPQASFPENLRQDRTSFFSLMPKDLTNFLIPCFIIGSVYKNLKEEAITTTLTSEEQQLFHKTCLELNQTARAIENYKKFASGKDDRYKPENDLGIAYDIASGFRGRISSGITAADAARVV